MSKQAALVEQFISSLKKSKNKLPRFAPHAGPREYDIRIYISSGRNLLEIVVRLSHVLGRVRFTYAIPSLGIYAYEDAQQTINLHDSKLFEPLYKLSLILGGDKIEIDTYYYKDHPKAGYLFWDTWYNSMGKIYDTQIHPKLVEVVTDYEKTLPPTGNFIDLFCGDGRFIAHLLAANKRIGRYSFYLMDYHRLSLQIAQETFKDNHKVKVMPAIDITSSVFNLNQFKNKASAISIVGGLCNGVLVKTEAIRLMRQVYGALQSKGLCFITGYTATLLNSEQFIKLGFTVEQCSIPENALIVRHPYQMYVLRKP